MNDTQMHLGGCGAGAMLRGGLPAGLLGHDSLTNIQSVNTYIKSLEILII